MTIDDIATLRRRRIRTPLSIEDFTQFKFGPGFRDNRNLSKICKTRFNTEDCVHLTLSS